MTVSMVRGMHLIEASTPTVGRDLGTLSIRTLGARRRGG